MIKNIFSTKGRMRRRDYFFHNLISNLLIIMFFKIFIVYDVANIIYSMFLVIIIGLYIMDEYTSKIRRFHDLDRKGISVLYLLIPFYNFFVLLHLYFAKGTIGNNKFGPSPKEINVNNKKWYLKKELLFILIIFLIGVAIIDYGIKQDKRNIAAIIQNPQINDYFICKNDLEEKYKFEIIKITEVFNDKYYFLYTQENYLSKRIAKKYLDDKYFLMFYDVEYEISKQDLRNFNIVYANRDE